MTLPLEGKIALVTGASGTIGSAIARRLATDGASILVHYQSDERGAAAVADAIVAQGGRAIVAHTDLRERDGAARLLAALDHRFGGALDVLINNAGMFDFASLLDTTDEAFEALFAVNVRSLFQLSREAARRMAERGWGRIVSIGSVFGEATPTAGLGTYCGSKFAVRGLTRARSRDLGPLGITVNCVQPALIQAEPPPTAGPAVDAMKRFSSVGRFGRADDIARTVAFLVHPDASYINGESITVDGGWSA